MNITELTLTANQICGNADGIAIALAIASGYKYEDGKRTDEITHMKVSAVFVDNSFEKMNVKIADLKPILTQEIIETAGGKKKVKFKNLTGRIYRTGNGEYAISASADAIEVLQ